MLIDKFYFVFYYSLADINQSFVAGAGLEGYEIAQGHVSCCVAPLG